MLNLWTQDPAIPVEESVVTFSSCHDCLTQVLVMSLLIALDVEERVPVPELGLPGPAQWDGGGLTVSHQHLTSRELHVSRARSPVQTGQALGTSGSLKVRMVRTLLSTDNSSPAVQASRQTPCLPSGLAVRPFPANRSFPESLSLPSFPRDQTSPEVQECPASPGRQEVL